MCPWWDTAPTPERMPKPVHCGKFLLRGSSDCADRIEVGSKLLCTLAPSGLRSLLMLVTNALFVGLCSTCNVHGWVEYTQWVIVQDIAYFQSKPPQFSCEWWFGLPTLQFHGKISYNSAVTRGRSYGISCKLRCLQKYFTCRQYCSGSVLDLFFPVCSMLPIFLVSGLCGDVQCQRSALCWSCGTANKHLGKLLCSVMQPRCCFGAVHLLQSCSVQWSASLCLLSKNRERDLGFCVRKDCRSGSWRGPGSILRKSSNFGSPIIRMYCTKYMIASIHKLQ